MLRMADKFQPGSFIRPLSGTHKGRAVRIDVTHVTHVTRTTEFPDGQIWYVGKIDGESHAFMHDDVEADTERGDGFEIVANPDFP
jgi:hypothetical protein